MKNIACIALLFFCAAVTLRAQDPTPAAPTPSTASSKAPVPITEEPHHHLILENSYVRVFRVEIISPDATLLHRHDSPYVYMSIGKAEFTNLVEGKPETRVTLRDGQLGYSKGGFSHIIRTENDTPFYNLTIELLHPQVNVRSDCAKVVDGPLTDCSAPQAAVANAARQIDSESKAPTVATSPGTGTNTPLAQLAPDTAKKAPSGPPTFTPILETDESTLKSATFPTDAKTSLDAGPGGTLLIVEPLSQFKVDFADGNSKLLSGGDPLWIQAGTSPTITNSSDQTPSTVLIFGFKDAPKPAGK
jgi:hypothetical protein